MTNAVFEAPATESAVRNFGVEHGAHDRRRPVGQLFEEARQLRDVVRADDEVDALELLDEALALLLRDAAGDDDHEIALVALLLGEAADLAPELLLGLLAHAAGVEDDHVRDARLGLGVARATQDFVHPLGVVHVHLTAERRDRVGGHAGTFVTNRKARGHFD